MNLSKVPADINSIDLVVNIFEAVERGKQSFGDLTRGVIRLVNVSDMGVVEGDEKIRVDLSADAYFEATGFLAITVVRSGKAWEVKRMDLTDERWKDTATSLNATNKVDPSTK